MAFTESGHHKPVQMVPGVTRTLICHGERAMVIRFDIARGGVVPMHGHPHEQIGFVASGRLRFTIGGESKVLQAGDGYSIPGNTPHTVEALEDSVAMDIFSPIREEYL